MAKKPGKQARSQGPLSSNSHQVTVSNPFPHWDALVNWLDIKKDKGGFRLNPADLDKFNEFLNSKDTGLLAVSLKVSLAEALFDQIHDNDQWKSFDKDGFVMITRLFLRADYCLSQERALYQLRMTFVERKKRDTSGSLYAIAEKLIAEFHKVLINKNPSVRIKRLVAHFLASLTVGDNQCKKALSDAIPKNESVYGDAIINHPDYIIRVTYCMIVSQVVSISERNKALDRFFDNADKGLLENFPEKSWEEDLNQWLKEFIAFFSALQQQEVELDQWLPPSFFALHVVINEFRQTKNGPTGLASFSKEGYLSLFFSNDINDFSCVDIKLCNVDDIKQADTIMTRHGRKTELRCLNISLKDFENLSSYFLFDLEDVQRADVSISITCHLDDSPDIESDILRLRDKHQGLLKKKMKVSVRSKEGEEDSPLEDIQLSQQITKLSSRKIKFLNQVSVKPDEFFDNQMGASTDTEVTLPPGILNDSDKPVPLKYANFKTQLTAEQRNYRSTASVSPSKQQKSRIYSAPEAVERNKYIAQPKKNLAVPQKPVKAKDRMQDKNGNLSSPVSARTPGGKQTSKPATKTVSKPALMTNNGNLSAHGNSPMENSDNYAFPSGEESNTNLRDVSTKKSSRTIVNKGRPQGIGAKTIGSTVKAVAKNTIQPKTQAPKTQASKTQAPRIQAPKTQTRPRKSTKKTQRLFAKQSKDGFEDGYDYDYDPTQLSESPPKRRRIDVSPKPSDEVKLNPRKSAIKADKKSKEIIERDFNDISDEIQDFSSSLQENFQSSRTTALKTNNNNKDVPEGPKAQIISSKRPNTGIKFQHRSSTATTKSRSIDIARSADTKKGPEDRPPTPSELGVDDIDDLMEAQEDNTLKKESTIIRSKKDFEGTPIREKSSRDVPLTNEVLSKKPQIIAFDDKKGALNQGHLTFSDDNRRPSSPDMDHPASRPYVVMEDEGSPSPPDPSGRTAEGSIDSDVEMPNIIESDHELDEFDLGAENVSMSVHTNDMAPESTLAPVVNTSLEISNHTQTSQVISKPQSVGKLQADKDAITAMPQVNVTKSPAEKRIKTTMGVAKKGEELVPPKVSESVYLNLTNDTSKIVASQKPLPSKSSRSTNIIPTKQEHPKFGDKTLKLETKEPIKVSTDEPAKEQAIDLAVTKPNVSMDMEQAQKLADQAYEMLQKRLALEMSAGAGPDAILQSISMAMAQSNPSLYLQPDGVAMKKDNKVVPETKVVQNSDQPIHSKKSIESLKSRPVTNSAAPEAKEFAMPNFNRSLPTPRNMGATWTPANISKPQQKFTKQFETPMSVIATLTPATFQDDRGRKFLRFASKLSQSASVEYSTSGVEHGVGSPLSRKATNEANKAVDETIPAKHDDGFLQRLKQVSEDCKDVYLTPKYYGGLHYLPNGEQLGDPDITLVNETSDDNNEETMYYGKSHKGADKNDIPGYHHETSKVLRQISEYLMKYLMTSEKTVNITLKDYHDEINRFVGDLNIQLEDGMKNARDKLSELKKLGFEAHNSTKVNLDGLAKTLSSDAIAKNLKSVQNNALANVKKEIEMLKI